MAFKLMSKTPGIFLALLSFTMGVTSHATISFTPRPLNGQTFIHDPSTIIRDGDRFYVFGTGLGIRTKSSTDLTFWTNGPSVFGSRPEWAVKTIPNFGNDLWAPDVIRLHGKFFLYYSASVWNKQTSGIALATNPTLNPTATNYFWTTIGPVIVSSTNSPFNTIDPCAFLDSDGKLWLAFGSYWQGIFLTELNPQTGLRISTNSPLYHLAWNHSIEAACLTRHDDHYYLFVNWGQCCQGTNSTYEVRVGRSKQITGPYLDREGKKLAEGGGSPFLQSNGRYIGPGHIGIVNDGATNGPTKFSYHYYDTDARGRSRLAMGEIDWTDGWPVAVNEVTNDWKLVWADEFNHNGPPDAANWRFEQGFIRNNEDQWYQPENALCTNGLLVIEARRESKPNPDFIRNSDDWRTSRAQIEFTSASLISRRMHQFTYGKVEMRARIDTRLGSWPAFWTLGATRDIPWPACGEVDIMEFYTGTVLANIGWQLDGEIKWNSVKKPIAELGGETWTKAFHIWTMEWDKTNIDLFLDGKLMNHLTLAEADSADQGNPFHRPEYIILNQAIGGECGGDLAQTQFPIRFEIDWVRVYQQTN
jgi:beta-glucanase (GH16 family)